MSQTIPTHREVANRGLLVVSVMLATLMQALDTTIANVALPNMQGSLSATQDQISWVLTSYIVAAAIATPATGWLASVMGRRRLLLIAIAGFTIASVLCGMASSIGAMVAFRLLQGLFGAALVPLSQSTLLDVYPREKHGAAMALWGMGVMVGPILGPPLGGWLTDAYSWHWVFLINVPIGALALFGVAASLPTDETRESRFDWRGFAFLAIGIGALQLFLDRGEQQDWFGSVEIQIEAALAFLGFYLYVVHWKTSERSFLDLGLFKDRNFLASNIFIFVLGVVLFATMALLPPFLQGLMNYPVVTTGLLLAPRGIGTLIAMMLVGRLMARGARRAAARRDRHAADHVFALADDAFQPRRAGTTHRHDRRDPGPWPRPRVRADLDGRLFDAADQRAHRSRRHLQPDAQHRLERRHLDRDDAAVAQHADQSRRDRLAPDAVQRERRRHLRPCSARTPCRGSRRSTARSRARPRRSRSSTISG